MTTITPIQPNVQPAPVQAGFTPRESLEQQLRIDQVVRATVSEGGQERVWLNVGRQKFLAETEIPLRTGVGLTLLVSKLVPRLEFQVLSDPLVGRIRQNLYLLDVPWSLDGVAALLPRLAAMPENQLSWARFLVLQGAVVDRAASGALAEMFARLGMDYEARLAQAETSGISTTLKKLLEAARKLGGEQGQLGEKLEHLSSLFELWQLIRLKQSQQSVEFWPLTLPWVEQGFMLAERGEGGDSAAVVEGERPWRLKLHLQLQQLGALEIDFLWEHSGLFLRFKCETAEQLSLLSAAQDELQGFVAALPLEGVAFALGAQAPASVLARLIGSDGIVDERV